MENKFKKEFNWVLSVLESCTNDYHIRSTKNLFENLLIKYNDQINCDGKDCLLENLIREDFQHYMDKKVKSLFF